MLPEFLSETNPNSLGVSVCIVILTSALYYFVIYPLFFHPLAKIPGPLPCKITKYWLIYKSWKEEKIGYVQSLHEKYGSIVRIGPDQVDICDASYIKDIYVANFDKTDFFAHFLFFGVPCAFSTIEKEKHKEFRKPTNRLYTKSKICSPQVMPRVEKVIYDTLSVFHQYHNHELNIFLVFCDMAMDAVTSISFGPAYDPLLADPFGKGKTICGDFSIQSSPGFWVTEMPYWLDWVVTKPVKEATKRCHDWVERQFNAAYQKLGSTTSKGVDIVLNSYFEYDPEEDKNKQLTKLFDQTHAKSEIYDHIVAGHIGTSTILTYFFLEMASQPEVQEKLREEVMKQLNNNEPIPTNNFNPIGYSVIDDEKKLPYLHACLNENFRLFTGVGQLPRVVPPKGMIFRGSEIVPPVKIPCNSVVSMQPWSVHRVAAVFPNPNKYDPQRWLEASEVQLKTMKSHLSPFGTGARMCLGQHLATAEVKMIMANILCRYKVQLADDFDYEKDGAMRDFFVTVPKSEKMMLKFIPLESSTLF